MLNIDACCCVEGAKSIQKAAKLLCYTDVGMFFMKAVFAFHAPSACLLRFSQYTQTFFNMVAVLVFSLYKKTAFLFTLQTLSTYFTTSKSDQLKRFLASKDNLALLDKQNCFSVFINKNLLSAKEHSTLMWWRFCSDSYNLSWFSTDSRE